MLRDAQAEGGGQDPALSLLIRVSWGQPVMLSEGLQ